MIYPTDISGDERAAGFVAGQVTSPEQPSGSRADSPAASHVPAVVLHHERSGLRAVKVLTAAGSIVYAILDDQDRVKELPAMSLAGLLARWRC